MTINRLITACLSVSVSLVLANELLVSGVAFAQDKELIEQIKSQLEKVDHTILDEGDTIDGVEPKRELGEYIKRQRRKVNEQDVSMWRKIKTRQQWESFRDTRIAALKRSLAQFPDKRAEPNMRVTKTLRGDGYVIECVVFDTWPGMQVTGNLYRPAKARESMPGILICHSHHNPKEESELQDMGMQWARQGCYVLVIDQLGHGERRQHPFRSSKDFDKEFRASRQDYYFRYNVGIQLHLIGDSQIGWMVSDLMHGVDLLLTLPNIDSKRIALLGAVAGGGDPAAVTAAVDPRIAAVVPFNFGGPQPESVFPLPKDAELSFNYVGGGSWESTRNLQSSTQGGFLPWLIVGSVAPRRLIYAHEFSWDRPKDPVWKRLETIFGFYDKRDHLGSANGFGRVTLSSKEASHCNNIGNHHREQIHPQFKQWFGISMPKQEFRDRRNRSDLWCVQDNKEASNIKLKPAYQVAGHVADERLATFRKSLNASKTPLQRTQLLRKTWRGILGTKEPQLGGLTMNVEAAGPIRTLRFTLGVDRNLHVPVLVLLPKLIPKAGCPVVVGVAQSGKSGFLKNRANEIAKLLAKGIAVALPDLRGTGETRRDSYRGRRSYATGYSSSILMFGDTLVGDRLSDLRQVIAKLRAQSSIDGSNVSVWGDSFAKNNANRRIAVPLRIDEEPAHSEPLGPALALFVALFDDKIKAVAASGSLISIRSVLDSQFVHVPHDFVVPQALMAGDLRDIALAVAPRSLRVERMVDGTNRPVTPQAIEQEWSRVRLAYKDKNEARLSINEKDSIAEWLIQQIQ
jgi:cephalosporin-C deacetylase-like acetyl esterase